MQGRSSALAEEGLELGGVRRFEELIAWQKARHLTSALYQMCSGGKVHQDFRFAGQLQAAAVSIMSNIAEGFERGSSGEFHQFLKVAKGSCAEVRSLLYVALDVGYLDKPSFDALFAQTEEVGRLVGGLRASVQRLKETT